jgi:hypothetical protein
MVAHSGTLSRARGQAAENQLDFLHNIYRAHDLAFIRHNGVNASMKNGEWIPEKSLPDYEGAIGSHQGLHVAFDAKFRTSLPYHHAKDKLHQSDYLWEIARFHAASFILLIIQNAEFPDGTAWALKPRDCWREFYGKGWSVNRRDLDLPEIAVPIPAWERVSPGYIPDWLQVYSSLIAPYSY